MHMYRFYPTEPLSARFVFPTRNNFLDARTRFGRENLLGCILTLFLSEFRALQ